MLNWLLNVKNFATCPCAICQWRKKHRGQRANFHLEEEGQIDEVRVKAKAKGKAKLQGYWSIVLLLVSSCQSHAVRERILWKRSLSGASMVICVGLNLVFWLLRPSSNFLSLFSVVLLFFLFLLEVFGIHVLGHLWGGYVSSVNFIFIFSARVVLGSSCALMNFFLC